MAPLMHDYKIGVKFQDGIVTLRGQVSSWEQMKTAICVGVAKMQGVTQVINNLTINASDMSATPALQQPDSLARLQAAAKTEPVVKMQPTARPNSVSNATFVSNGAPVAARPVAATERSGLRQAAAGPTRVIRPVPVAYAQADATGASRRLPRRQCPVAAAPMASGTPLPMAAASNSFVCTHGWGRVSGTVRSRPFAQLRLANLRVLPELRGGHISAAVFGDCVALHRPVLSLPASSAWMAKSDAGVERRLVVPGLQEPLN